MIDFELVFPALSGTSYRITSPFSERYNCIAWAVGDPDNWWWPGIPEKTIWPAVAPREETVSAFEAVFIGLGFHICDGDAREPGFEKVALFAHPNGLPTHAARQLLTGQWTSKLGQFEDIEHDLRALEGDVYGRVVRIFRRPGPI